MTVKLLAEQHLELLSLTGGCTDLSKSTLVKMPHCWKSQVVADLFLPFFFCCLYWCTVHITLKKIIFKNSVYLDQLFSGNA